MAGIHEDRGDRSHRIVSGEVPVVGLRVYDNNLDQGEITKVETTGLCGYYCEAWHTVTYPDGRTMDMNCDRLTTRRPSRY